MATEEKDADRNVDIDEFNTVWLPRLVTEAGLAGVAAWLLVLVWSVGLTLKARPLHRPPSVDAGIVMAMPGLAALTLVASAYNPAPVTPAFEIVFWACLGICLRLATISPPPDQDSPVDVAS